MSREQQHEPERPLLRVVRGEPSAEELAALVAVLSARAGAAADVEPPAPAVSPWAERRALLNPPVVVGPGAWQRSGFAPGVRTRADW